MSNISGAELINLYESSEGDTKIMYRKLIIGLANDNASFAKYAKSRGITV